MRCERALLERNLSCVVRAVTMVLGMHSVCAGYVGPSFMTVVRYPRKLRNWCENSFSPFMAVLFSAVLTRLNLWLHVSKHGAGIIVT
jgi:hypothetical protein